MTKNTAVDITLSFDFITQRARIVYITLASFGNKNNKCFPSVATIAKRCGLSESTVHRAIADLIAMEIIIKAANFRENNGCTSNTYTLLNPIDNIENNQEMIPAPSQSDRGEGVILIPAIEYDNSFNKNDLSSSLQTDAREDEKADIELDGVLRNCELPYIRLNYGADFSVMLENTICRLFYSERLRLGDVVLPQSVIRESLRHLNYHTLEIAIEKLRNNSKRKVKNSSSYLTVLLYNAITEMDIDWYVREHSVQ